MFYAVRIFHNFNRGRRDAVKYSYNVYRLFRSPHSKLLCFLCAIFFWNFATSDENRPYEFSFHVVDFQHRYEKKGTDGLITGEYGFITADGVYHETAYATDKNDDFIITRMTRRRIKSLKDAEEIFKDRPEAARKLVEAVARACGSCKISVKSDNLDRTTGAAPVSTASATRMKAGPVLQRMINSLEEKKIDPSQGRSTVPQKPKDASNDRRGKSLVEGLAGSTIDSTKRLVPKGEHVYTKSKGTETNQQPHRNTANDLYYRFNYTITSHGHQENGYRNGEKDGNYRARSENGVDTRVKYVSNEFSYQPNVSFVPSTNAATERHKLEGYSFLWYWP